VLGRVVAVLALALTVSALPASARDAGRDGDPRPGAAGIGDPYFPLDGNGGIDVLHYDVRDAYAFDTGVLSGRTTLRVRATHDLSRFNLDFLLPVSRVKVGGRAADVDRTNRHELRITPARPIAAGTTFRVRVDYRGRPARAAYRGERNWLADGREVVTMNQPHMAPWWFPANDHPSDKATMDVRVTVPKRFKVVSNGLPVSRRVRGDVATSHWRSAEPMAPYLAFFAAGSFAVRKGTHDGRPWIVAVSNQLPPILRRPGMRLLLTSPSITAWLEDRLGPYPFESTGGLMTSLNPGFALENQTRPTYPAVGEGAISLVVHELAHQWFGDSVAIGRWRDIWLNEGFATFMERYYAETHGGATAAAWLDAAYESKRSDSAFWALRLDDPGAARIFDGAVYERGAMALQALRTRIGEDTFWTLLRTWASTRAGGSATVPEFVALAESLSGQDLGAFFDAWLSSTARPAKTAANGFA
jgi:aminopeptidase N